MPRNANSLAKFLLSLAAVSVALLLTAYPDPRTRGLLRCSFGLAAWTTLLAVPIGCFFGWAVSRSDIPGKRILSSAVYLGVLIPLYMHGAVWEAGFGQLGWFPLWRDQFGNSPPLRGFYGALWVHVWAAVPWMALFAKIHLSTSADHVEDNALLDANIWQLLWHITRVQLAPVATVGALWIFVWVAGEITITDLFQVRTFAEEVYIGYALDTVGSENAVVPSTVAIGCLLGCLVMLALATITFALPLLEVTTAQASILRIGKGRWVATCAATLIAMMIVVIPLANLVAKAGWELTATGDNAQSKLIGWSAAKACKLILNSPKQHRQEFAWSLLISQVTSATTVVIALVWIDLTNRHRLCQWSLGLWLAICLALPGPVIGLAIARLFTAMPWAWSDYLYSKTIAAPWLALSIKCFPILVMTLWIGLRTLPGELREAAKLDGASALSRLLFVTIPSASHLLLFCFLIGVVINLGDLAAGILVMPPGVSTLAVRIFGLIHYGVEDRLAALCLATIGLCWLCGALCAWAWPKPNY